MNDEDLEKCLSEEGWLGCGVAQMGTMSGDTVSVYPTFKTASEVFPCIRRAIGFFAPKDLRSYFRP